MKTRMEADPDLPVYEIAFDTLRELKDLMLPNLSGEGLFLPSDTPSEPSTVLRFRLVLPDDFVLVEGAGVVVWSRFPDFDRSSPPGMGVRFVVLPEPSRQVIEQLLEEHAAAGGVPFDIDHLPGDAEPDPGALDETVACRVDQELTPERIRLTVRGEARPGPEGAAGSGSAGDAFPARHHPDGPPGLEEAESAIGRPEVVVDDERFEAPRRISGAIVDPGNGPEPAQREPMADLDREPVEEVWVDSSSRRSRGPWLWVAAAAVVLAAAVTAVLVSGRRPEASGARATPVAPEAETTAAIPTPGADTGDEAEPAADAVVREAPDAGADEPSRDGSALSEIAALPRSPVAPGAATTGPTLASISWRMEPEGTSVALELAGGVDSGAVAVTRLAAPPRLLVRIPGVAEDFPQYRLAVDSPEVVAVRSWLHSELEPPELHVVLDLQGEHLGLVDLVRDPARVVLRVGPSS